mgnify:CR=1 FL=1
MQKKWFILILVLVMSSLILVQKDKIEESNKRVELSADYELFAQAEQLDLITKAAGFSSLALRDLELLTASNEVEAERIFKLLRRRGLQLIPRFRAGLGPQTLAEQLAEFQEQAAVEKVIFQGREVVGYKHSLKKTAEVLTAHGIKLGLIETFLATQQGAKELAQKMEYQAVRVHSIKAGELIRLGVEEVVNRYFKAVVERNVRLVYIKPFPQAGQTAEFIMQLRARLEEEGYQLALAAPFAKSQDNKSIKVILLGLLFLLASFELNKFSLYSSLGGGIILVITYLFWEQLCLALVALSIAVVVPSGEYFYLLDMPGEQSLREQGVTFIKITLVSTAAGLVITALLFERAYLLQVRSFRGVKVAFLLPLILSTTYYLYQQLDGNKQQALRNFLARPVSRQELLILCGLLILLIFYLGRTGNQFFLGVSNLEVALRNRLGAIFRLRPRFKSFLIGHPLLLIALSQGEKGYYPWLLLGGLIGQINLINTLVHLHMPLRLSLLRVGLGALLGFVVYLPVKSLALLLLRIAKE